MPAAAAEPIVVAIAGSFHRKRVLAMKQYGTLRNPIRQARTAGKKMCSALKAQLRLP